MHFKSIVFVLSAMVFGATVAYPVADRSSLMEREMDEPRLDLFGRLIDVDSELDSRFNEDLYKIARRGSGGSSGQRKFDIVHCDCDGVDTELIRKYIKRRYWSIDDSVNHSYHAAKVKYRALARIEVTYIRDTDASASVHSFGSAPTLVNHEAEIQKTYEAISVDHMKATYGAH